MGGWIIVRADPYAAVSDKDGHFTIADLPAGKELEFQLWQEKVGFPKTSRSRESEGRRQGTLQTQARAGRGQKADVQGFAQIIMAHSSGDQEFDWP